MSPAISSPGLSDFLPAELYDPSGAVRSYVEVRDGREKTQLITALAMHGATFEPLIRDTAVALMRGLPRSAHAERVQRLHEFVRDSVGYHREPIEMLHPATYTLLRGADCDDHVILLGALAWALRYPFVIEPIGGELDPSHYTIALGYPPSDFPYGDASTVWQWAETTTPARTGEHVLAAVARTGISGGA